MFLINLVAQRKNGQAKLFSPLEAKQMKSKYLFDIQKSFMLKRKKDDVCDFWVKLLEKRWIRSLIVFAVNTGIQNTNSRKGGIKQITHAASECWTRRKI